MKKNYISFFQAAALSFLIFYETSVFTESDLTRNRLGRDFDIMIMDLAN
jgi:hypothetical protein